MENIGDLRYTARVSILESWTYVCRLRGRGWGNNHHEMVSFLIFMYMINSGENGDETQRGLDLNELDL